jgi:hypothetical protein
MRQVRVYRVFSSVISIPDTVFDAMDKGGLDEKAGHYNNIASVQDFLHAIKRPPKPVDEVFEELEVLPVG